MMKKTALLIVLAIALPFSAFSQEKVRLTPFLHQTGMYYSSDRITSDGFGFGAGVHLGHPSRIAGQADVNILWGNGNAITTRLALGYEKKGTWTPGIYGTLNLVWGQRVQVLDESGEKPSSPALAVGIRVTPIKFQTKKGYVSALEFGIGFGPDMGRSIEFSVISIGLKL